MENQKRSDLEKAATAALKGAQQPAGDLRDLNEEQLTFVTSYWSQRPRVSNDDLIKAMKRS